MREAKDPMDRTTQGLVLSALQRKGSEMNPNVVWYTDYLELPIQHQAVLTINP